LREDEMKFLKRGERERRETVTMPRFVSTIDQVCRVEVSMGDFWWVMARRRMIWIVVRKAERVKIRAMRRSLRMDKAE
jgi:hypothetical protein